MSPDPDFKHKHDFLSMVIDWGFGIALMCMIFAMVYYAMGWI